MIFQGQQRDRFLQVNTSILKKHIFKINRSRKWVSLHNIMVDKLSPFLEKSIDDNIENSH